eukprot:CAMPEP_0184671596 /NCGR_PEP_ID=MMETSP0308-20130426/85597_1 /TAXON_ID=38269 /ORGANISM="Gloeochaete witrockiana, Strain SAG 46.84" /LENGTH=190 /DNA_ID=CAMNT_0027118759 /DNA_START=1385 /DNA_END=1957 /DNA_ORIENTATION=+
MNSSARPLTYASDIPPHIQEPLFSSDSTAATYADSYDEELDLEMEQDRRHIPVKKSIRSAISSTGIQADQGTALSPWEDLSLEELKTRVKEQQKLIRGLVQENECLVALKDQKENIIAQLLLTDNLKSEPDFSLKASWTMASSLESDSNLIFRQMARLKLRVKTLHRIAALKDQLCSELLSLVCQVLPSR